jgi:hypothetical protein
MVSQPLVSEQHLRRIRASRRGTPTRQALPTQVRGQWAEVCDRQRGRGRIICRNAAFFVCSCDEHCVRERVGLKLRTQLFHADRDSVVVHAHDHAHPARVCCTTAYDRKQSQLAAFRVQQAAFERVWCRAAATGTFAAISCRPAATVAHGLTRGWTHMTSIWPKTPLH